MADSLIGPRRHCARPGVLDRVRLDRLGRGPSFLHRKTRRLIAGTASLA